MPRIKRKTKTYAKRMNLCQIYKIIKEFKRSEDNSNASIAKRLNISQHQVSMTINRYLLPKTIRVKTQVLN